MGLFGPREPCPQCGQKVKKPSDPSDFLCPHCGKPGPWATPEQVSGWQAAETERERRESQQAEARQRYTEVLAGPASGASSDATQLPVLAPQTGQSPEKLARKRTEAFAKYLRHAVSDEIMTPEEETHVQSLTRALGLRCALCRHPMHRRPEDADMSKAGGGSLLGQRSTNAHDAKRGGGQRSRPQRLASTGVSSWALSSKL